MDYGSDAQNLSVGNGDNHGNITIESGGVVFVQGGRAETHAQIGHGGLANDDPDGDHVDNLLEFFAGSDPVDATSRAQGILTKTPTGFLYTYRRARGLVGVTHALQAGPLTDLVDFTPEASEVTTTPIWSEVDEISVALPPDFGPYLRQSVSME